MTLPSNSGGFPMRLRSPNFLLQQGDLFELGISDLVASEVHVLICDAQYLRTQPHVRLGGGARRSQASLVTCRLRHSGAERRSSQLQSPRSTPRCSAKARSATSRHAGGIGLRPNPSLEAPLRKVFVFPRPLDGRTWRTEAACVRHCLDARSELQNHDVRHHSPDNVVGVVREVPMMLRRAGRYSTIPGEQRRGGLPHTIRSGPRPRDEWSAWLATKGRARPLPLPRD